MLYIKKKHAKLLKCTYIEDKSMWEADLLLDQTFILIDSSVAPEIFLKVLECKRLLASGEARTASEAAKLCGISRSAFYKYRDFVHSYSKSAGMNIMTICATLIDKAGVLSSLLLAFYNAGANILTVNQNIPIDGVALITISARIDHLSMGEEEFLQNLRALDGIEKVQRIAGA